MSEQGFRSTTSAATSTPSSAFDWAEKRGDKWRDQLDGMEAMLAPVDEPLIDALRLDRAYRIADIGCGGGGTTREIARRAPRGSTVDGFDISASLIDSARARTPTGERSISFRLADVAQAAPPNGAYDRLLSRFGLMFFDDPPMAFENLARWLSVGGKFAFAVWGRGSDNQWLAMIREVAAQVVELPASDPAAPGPLRYAEPAPLLALLDRAGFVELHVQQWRGTFAIGGGLPVRQAAEFALRSSSAAQPVLDAGEHAFERALQALTVRFEQHQDNGVVRLAASAQIVTGSRTA